MNIGQKDQLIQAMSDLALMAWEYYTKLVMAGFTVEQALTLTVSYQAALLAGVGPSK
ncbi:hypothetical protein [Paenibacillus illinoisensis]|uniref:hypothetical protein n=1 Tax=Paenibacillus illinoisensis TaxID=59845 RepID=UPI0013E3349C|nr:hypothetical protein [Paenibacillus illinoisensis]